MFGNENGKEWEKPYGSPMGWELVTKLGMGMGRNGNRLHGNGRDWECKKPFPGICSVDRGESRQRAIFCGLRQRIDCRPT